MNPLRAFGLWLAGETKSRTTGETIPRWQLGRPFRPPTPVITTEEAVRRGYTRASIVYACIDLISKTAVSVPLRVYERHGAEEYEYLPDHPLQQVLNTPNARLTRRRMYYRLVQHLMLTGNGVWFKVRVPKSGPPTQLWPISPDLIQPVPDAKNLVSHYVLNVNGEQARIEARDVVHVQLENPETPLWGVGPLQAAMQDTNLYLGNKAWNLRTVERGAVTPGVLEVPEDLTEDQFKAIRAQLDERTFGNEDAGREMILGSGMKYHRMSLTGEELGFLESMRFGREEIAMVFGVPVAMLTPENATLANVEAYNKQFWENTIVPLNIGIADILTHALVPDYDKTGRLEIAHDYSQVPAMQDSLDNQSQTAERLVRTGFTIEGVNRLLDLGFEEGEIKPPQPAPDFTPDAEQEEREGQEDAPKRRPAPTSTKQLDFLWQRADTDRQAWEQEVANRALRLFQREGEAVAKTWDDTGRLEATVTAHKGFTSEWVALLTGVYVEAGRHFARREYDRLAPKARKDFDPLTIAIGWAERNAAKKVVEISSTTEEGIREVITRGLTPDPDTGYRMTTDEIAREIRARYGVDLGTTFGVREWNIARTELGFAMNYGHDQGARALADEHDLPMEKGWASSADDRVRDSHAALHGEYVPMDSTFSNGLEYPGDPSGPAEEVIACRCVLVHRIIH